MEIVMREADSGTASAPICPRASPRATISGSFNVQYIVVDSVDGLVFGLPAEVKIGQLIRNDLEVPA
jgi:hypothetical protein